LAGVDSAAFRCHTSDITENGSLQVNKRRSTENSRNTLVLKMAGKKAAGENTKKAAGNAKKAEAAAQKAAVENQKKAAVEDEEWSKGAKSSAKK
jgi:hypothetical protein